MPSLPSAPYKGLHATGERKTMNTSEFTNGVLLIYNHPLWSNAPTILEHVNAFAAHSQFNVWTVNTEGGFPPALRSLRFRVILLHYSLFGYWPNLQLSDSFLRYLSECGRSYKIAFFQDEYQFCQQRFGFVNRYGIDSVYTLVEPELFDAVYRRYTGVQSLIYTIPGYVSDDLVERGRKLGKPDEVRRIDIGYRGRRLDYSMGRGAQEKKGAPGNGAVWEKEGERRSPGADRATTCSPSRATPRRPRSPARSTGCSRRPCRRRASWSVPRARSSP